MLDVTSGVAIASISRLALEWSMNLFFFSATMSQQPTSRRRLNSMEPTMANTNRENSNAANATAPLASCCAPPSPAPAPLSREAESRRAELQFERRRLELDLRRVEIEAETRRFVAEMELRQREIDAETRHSEITAEVRRREIDSDMRLNQLNAETRKRKIEFDVRVREIEAEEDQLAITAQMREVELRLAELAANARPLIVNLGIVMPSSHRVQVAADLRGTVLLFKRAVEMLTRVPVARQRLAFGGQLLHNDRTLASYNVRDSVTLVLSVAPVASV